MVVQKYSLLDECLKALITKTINLLILKGEPGIGKSFITITTLKREKIDFEYNNTYTTPLAFYKFLYENRKKEVIVLDDLYGISDPIIKSMFKSVCGELPNGKRIVGYNSTSPILEKEGLPNWFEFNAGVVLIFNDEFSGFEPIINRGIKIDFNLKFEEKLKIFRKIKSIDSDVLDYVIKNCNQSTGNLSIRTLILLSRLKKDGYDFNVVAKEILEVNEEILDLINLDEKEWCRKTGKTRRTYYRHKKKYNVS